MRISLIVAADEQNGIGKENRLLCYLPADLKYFKATTTGHHILMGRKTFESVGKPLPGRVNIVITANADWRMDGCSICNTIEDGVKLAQNAGEQELFITGGGNIYRQSLEIADRVYLTRIHHVFDADTFFPQLNKETWQLVSENKQVKDEKNLFDYSYMVFDRSRK